MKTIKLIRAVDRKKLTNLNDCIAKKKESSVTLFLMQATIVAIYTVILIIFIHLEL